MKCLIVGCQRSGTTLLKEILISGNLLIFEENWIAAYLYRERFHAYKWGANGHFGYDDDDTRIWDKSARDFFVSTYQQYFNRYRAFRHDGWGMKSPGLNMAHAIPYLAKLFPDLRFIYVVRDPRDVFASIESMAKGFYKLPENYYDTSINGPDLVDLALRPYEYWAKVNREILKHRQRMPDRFYTMYFEKLMENPLGIVKEICDFLEIPFIKNMLEPLTRKISQASVVSMTPEDYENGNFVTKASAKGRWEKDLIPYEVEKLTEYSAAIALELGYKIGAGNIVTSVVSNIDEYPLIDFEIPKNKINGENGFCYTYYFKTYAGQIFSNLACYSSLILNEDGQPLSYRNSLHDDIRDLGQGRYSLWFGGIFFSSSDNSDPRINQRRYSIKLPGYIRLLEMLPDDQVAKLAL